ncbi:rhomboid family-domain-containing protein [Abortiporus biennis]|nr:rhomboid family-domain-containing protein [Abortiporus biennis]
MTSTYPQDEPFDHEAVSRKDHRRGESSANLLEDNGVRDSTYDPTSAHYADGGYGYYGDANDSKTVVPEMTEAGQKQYQDLEYSEPFDVPRAQPMAKQPNALQRALGLRPYSLAQRIDDKKRGVVRQKHPIVAWTLSLAMLGIIIFELVKNSQAQGTPVSFHPVVNPMLGPSPYVLINIGARFPPCMKVVTDLTPTTSFPCMNDTANPPDRLCSLETLCGFGGFDDKDPDQWFRFITPIFLHSGIIHFLLNMLAQCTASAEVEREMGSVGFLILYFATGIFGNVLGGNFSLVGAPSVGASGAIFGTIAVAWIDLFAHWKLHYRPGRKLVFMIIELLIGFAIGFIPFVDNFAHIGGFLMGLLVGMVLYPVISPTRRHAIIVWTLRIAAIPLAVVLFVVLIRNFYTSDPYAACSWCRYLSCIPSSINNHCKGTGFTSTSGTSI